MAIELTADLTAYPTAPTYDAANTQLLMSVLLTSNYLRYGQSAAVYL